MKQIRSILCWFLVLLLLAVGVFVWWQRDNLKALYLAKTRDAETILQEAETQRKERQKELEEYGVILKTPTQEEMDALINGESIAVDPPDTGTSPPSSESPPAKQNAASDIIERCVRELYDCETALMARLGSMKQALLDEWLALSANDRTNDKKFEIGRHGLDQCYDLEIEIDAQVKNILAKYRAELKKIQSDTSPMDTLWKHYCEEKASAKAYYLNKYL